MVPSGFSPFAVEYYFDFHRISFSNHPQRDLFTWPAHFHLGKKIVYRAGFFPIHTDDQISIALVDSRFLVNERASALLGSYQSEAT